MAAVPPTPYASASLYVGDLATDVTEALLFEIFNAVGPVISVRVCRDASTRKSLGYAYVNFHRVEDAERALDTMNFKPIRNKQCRIMWSHRDPSLRKSGYGNIFVKGLAPNIDNKTLYDTFSLFGNILSCKVATDSQGKSLKYGFVHYEGDESAQAAITKVDRKEIGGMVVSVTAFKSRKDRGGDGKSKFTNVYVKNIPTTMDENQLRNMFAVCGTIQSCYIAQDEKGASRGFGFINFSIPEEAQAACEQFNDFQTGFQFLDGKVKNMIVVRAQKKDERLKELRERFDQLRIEKQKSYLGVNLYVKNLSDQVDDTRLRDEFSKFGNIQSAAVMYDGANKSRGFGFVCFTNQEEATKAVTEMNSRMLDHKPLYVALAQRKDVRRQQLEAQYARKIGVGGPMNQNFPMAPPYHPPMGYPGMPQRYYPQQMLRFQQVAQQPQGPGMMSPHPGVNYQLMAISNSRGGGGGRGSGRGGQGGRGGGQGGARGGKQQGAPGGSQGQGQYKYSENVRNQRPDQGRPTQMQQAPEAQAGPERLTSATLAMAPEESRKQMIGERLFPLIKQMNTSQPGKITGMLLEMDNGELLHLLESRDALKEKVEEALAVLQEYAQQADS